MYTMLNGLGGGGGGHGGGGHGGGGHHGGGGGGGGHHGGGGRRPVVVNVQSPMPVFNDQPQAVIGGPYLFAVEDGSSGVSVAILENNIWRVVGSNLAAADADKMAQFWRSKQYQVRVK